MNRNTHIFVAKNLAEKYRLDHEALFEGSLAPDSERVMYERHTWDNCIEEKQMHLVDARKYFLAGDLVKASEELGRALHFILDTYAHSFMPPGTSAEDHQAIEEKISISYKYGFNKKGFEKGKSVTTHKELLDEVRDRANKHHKFENLNYLVHLAASAVTSRREPPEKLAMAKEIFVKKVKRSFLRFAALPIFVLIVVGLVYRQWGVLAAAPYVLLMLGDVKVFRWVKKRNWIFFILTLGLILISPINIFLFLFIPVLVAHLYIHKDITLETETWFNYSV